MSKDKDDLREEGLSALESLRGNDAVEEEEEKVEEEVLETVTMAAEPTPEEAEEIRREKKERIAQVLSRGVLNQKLEAIVRNGTPDGRRGKLVLDSEDKILQLQNLGFTFDYRQGATGLNATSDGRIRAGDLVLMTVSEEDYSILDEVRSEKVKMKLSAGRDDYKRRVQGASQGEDVSFDDSRTEVITSRG